MDVFGEDKTPAQEHEDFLRDRLDLSFLQLQNETPALWPRQASGLAISGQQGLSCILTTDNPLLVNSADLKAVFGEDHSLNISAVYSRYGTKHVIPTGELGENGRPIYYEKTSEEPFENLTYLYGLAHSDTEFFPEFRKKFSVDGVVSRLNDLAIFCLARFSRRSEDAVLKICKDGKLINVSSEKSRILVNCKEATFASVCISLAEWILPKSFNHFYRKGLERGNGEPTGWYKTDSLSPPHIHSFESRLLAYSIGVLSAGFAPDLGNPSEEFAAFIDNAKSGGHIGRLTLACKHVADALYFFSKESSRSVFANGLNIYSGLSESRQINEESSSDIGAMIDKGLPL